MNFPDMIQNSLDYIEDNLQSELTAQELAERAGFSLFHYYRLFQSAVGMPVMQYILRRRLLHGVYAIRCGSTGIEASLRYGFDTYPGFYRAFQREFGCTPSAFIKLSRAKQPYRICLKKEEHIIVTHKKVAEILKNWNLENETITDIYYEGTGNRNENACYVGDAYVLKYTANPGKMKNHQQLSRLIAQRGLASAVPVATVDGKDYVQEGELYYTLTRRMEGEQMHTAELYADENKARFVGEIVGHLDLALENADVCVKERDLYETAEKALDAIRDMLGLSTAFCEEYLRTFGELYPALPKQIVHRDPNPGNIICCGEQYGFIDFELSERCVRIYDPCYAATAILSETFGRDNEVWLKIYRNIMLGYDSVVRLSEEERRAIPYVILANQLLCTAWFAGKEKFAALFETNKKMTLWVAENFDRLVIEF